MENTDTQQNRTFEETGRPDPIPETGKPNPEFFRHAQIPYHMGRPDRSDGHALGVGICGDSIEFFIDVAEQRLQQVRHVPKGCLYTLACGSAVSKLAEGRLLEEVLKIQPEDVAVELGGLPPDHMHCANLAVNTLGEALEDYYRKLWGKSHADL